jgi:hypothetical protein
VTTRPLAVAAALVALALAAPARADRPASVGPYAELGLGATGFLGDAGQAGAVGPAAALRGGYDVFSWLSIGGRLQLDNHEATVPPPPDHQYFQIYQLAADARLGVRIGAVALFAEGGLGLAMISTNVLDKVGITDLDERWSPLLAAGGGAEYQLANRHYALGLAGEWSLMPAFEATQAVGGRLYLRYTY